ncbi:MAG: SIS domain-containing protein [Chloroflexi bacterium]|nr:MAG: SIS domain-containing protein [Chloroflexota bacterium]MBL1192788.1 SIS domain-containing protein [Chloroflexota bacterium]NOH10082.1 SIS domain-containing protein [Chloroflexota bacterium]
MRSLDTQILINQINDLPTVNREQVSEIDRRVRTVLSPLEFLSIRRVFITGDGDSYHAARATELAFEEIAQMDCEPLSAQRFLDYKAAFIKSWAPHDNLVMAVSAGGRTERGVQAMERAKEYGAMTVAVTGTPDSPFAQTGERIIMVDLPDFGPSPGIRTYNASLIGLLLMAIRIGELKDRYHQTEANAMRQEMTDLDSIMQATIEACEKPAREAAEAFKGAPVYMYLGSGPSYGTALFSAAKVVETANEFAFGQDLEEWAHVENLAYPDDMPTFVIAPPGRSHWRAAKLAETAKERGRRVVVVVQDGDDEIAKHADFVLPVMGEVREAFSPLVYHIGMDLFATYLTEAFGRKVFQTDNPAFAQFAGQ